MKKNKKTGLHRQEVVYDVPMTANKAFNQKGKGEKKMIVNIPNTEELINDLMTCYACKFSREAAKAMIEWLDEIYYGEDVFQWDPVGIGCEWSEWKSLEEWGIQYFGGVMQMLEAMGGCTLDECADCLEEYIYFRGSLIQFEGGVLVSSF